MPDDPQTMEPSRTAMLVMDFQPMVLSRAPDPDGLVERVASAIELVRSRGACVAYVRVAFEDSDYAGVPETNATFSAMAANRLMRADAPETAIDERLAPVPGDIVVRKTRIGAFSTTDLDAQLRGRGVDTLILAGISTGGVITSTVRDGADRDYRLFVLSDGVADSDTELHEALIRLVLPRQATVISIAELTERLAS